MNATRPPIRYATTALQIHSSLRASALLRTIGAFNRRYATRKGTYKAPSTRKTLNSRLYPKDILIRRQYLKDVIRDIQVGSILWEEWPKDRIPEKPIPESLDVWYQLALQKDVAKQITGIDKRQAHFRHLFWEMAIKTSAKTLYHPQLVAALTELNLTLDDAVAIANYMGHESAYRWRRLTARAIYISTAAGGHVGALLHILQNEYMHMQEDRTDPRVHPVILEQIRSRLEELAHEMEDQDCMSLLGQILYTHDKKHEEGKDLLKRAANMKKPRWKDTNLRLQGSQLRPKSRPPIVTAATALGRYLYVNEYQFPEGISYLELGAIRDDDPYAYKLLAVAERTFQGVTANYITYLTKAATSGDADSAMRLAELYAMTSKDIKALNQKAQVIREGSLGIEKKNHTDEPEELRHLETLPYYHPMKSEVRLNQRIGRAIEWAAIAREFDNRPTNKLEIIDEEDIEDRRQRLTRVEKKLGQNAASVSIDTPDEDEMFQLLRERKRRHRIIVGSIIICTLSIAVLLLRPQQRNEQERSEQSSMTRKFERFMIKSFGIDLTYTPYASLKAFLSQLFGIKSNEKPASTFKPEDAAEPEKFPMTSEQAIRMEEYRRQLSAYRAAQIEQASEDSARATLTRTAEQHRRDSLREQRGEETSRTKFNDLVASAADGKAPNETSRPESNASTSASERSPSEAAAQTKSSSKGSWFWSR